MTLPVSVLQSLISRQRVDITDLHALAAWVKGERTTASQRGCPEIADEYDKQFVKLSKDIKKLVFTQKCLKKELGLRIHLKRCEAFCRKAKMNAMSDAGET